jgi:competence protein ComEC
MVKIHFLNVGHGDCTIIEHASGNLTMIDINNGGHLDEQSRQELAAAYGITGMNYIAAKTVAEALGQSFRKTILSSKGYDIELQDPVDYFISNFGKTRSIFRYVQTHPDLDHMRGLYRLSQEGISILNFWDTDHQKSMSGMTEEDEKEWNEYERLRKSTERPKAHFKFRGDEGMYWNKDDVGLSGDGIHILAPTAKLRDDANESGDINAHSYVLFLRFGEIKVVLGGDATEKVWQSIYDTYGDVLKCHVLKASHHGRDSGYHSEAVKAMSPDYTIVSVGKKPETDASNKYRQYSRNVWSTRWRGNITLEIENNKGTIVPQYDREDESEGALALQALANSGNARPAWQ